MDDRLLVCRDCNEEFTFTGGEQAFFKERGFPDPQRCVKCRKAKRARQQNFKK